MARNRTIRPEFWACEKIGACSPIARLLFIGLWNFCDDGGRMPFAPKYIRMRIFGYDDIASTEIEAFVGELVTSGLVDVYEVGAARYLQVID